MKSRWQVNEPFLDLMASLVAGIRGVDGTRPLPETEAERCGVEGGGRERDKESEPEREGENSLSFARCGPRCGVPTSHLASLIQPWGQPSGRLHIYHVNSCTSVPDSGNNCRGVDLNHRFVSGPPGWHGSINPNPWSRVEMARKVETGLRGNGSSNLHGTKPDR